MAIDLFNFIKYLTGFLYIWVNAVEVFYIHSILSYILYISMPV
jgi:hypothetical protein